MSFTVISLALFITSLDAAGLKTAPIASVLDLLTGAAMNVNPFAPLNNPLDCFVPLAPVFTLRGAFSATGSAPLCHVSSQALRANRMQARKSN